MRQTVKKWQREEEKIYAFLQQGSSWMACCTQGHTSSLGVVLPQTCIRKKKDTDTWKLLVDVTCVVARHLDDS